MKVVLFCGGLGMRLKEYSEIIPKPMINIGYRPILWYVMKYYAHFGHKDFILCLGYKADIIKNYFLNYNEYLSNDFTLTQGGKEIALASSDIQDWKITFVDTGLHANIGMRLKAVQKYVQNEEYFLANYTDGLSNCPLPAIIDTLKAKQKTGIFVSTRPGFTFHIVTSNGDGAVTDIKDVSKSEIWLNAGYFVFRPSIFETSARARSSSRAIPAADRQERAHHLQTRGLLPRNGHVQGKAASRRHVRPRRDAVGGLEAGRHPLSADGSASRMIAKPPSTDTPSASPAASLRPGPFSGAPMS